MPTAFLFGCLGLFIDSMTLLPHAPRVIDSLRTVESDDLRGGTTKSIHTRSQWKGFQLEPCLEASSLDRFVPRDDAKRQPGDPPALRVVISHFEAAKIIKEGTSQNQLSQSVYTLSNPINPCLQ